MALTINPSRFNGKPLFLQSTEIGGQVHPDDYIAVCDDQPIARIMIVQKSFGLKRWDWSIIGPYIPAEMGVNNGSSASLEDAKLAVRMTFDRWLAWSSVNTPARWNH
jgi:hypothetical protein